MSTISKLVIEMMADPQGVKTGLDKAEGYLRQFGRTADQALATANRGAAGQALADNIIGGLQDRFASQADRVREQLFRGILDPKSAAEHARQAAQAMNTTILATLAELRGRGLATPEIEHQLIGSLSNTGLAVEQQAERSLGGFGRIRNGLLSLFASMSGTIPILDRIGGQLGAFAVGGGIVIGVVAGLAALAFAWEEWTKKAREAKAAMEEWEKSDDAFRARAKAGGAAAALLSGITGNTANQIDVVGMTKQIDDLRKAVTGFQAALKSPDHTYVGRLNEVNQSLVALRTKYADGKISLAAFNAELAKTAALHPDYAPQIAQTAELVAMYDAAQKALKLLTAAEEQRAANLKSDRDTYGASPGLAQELDNANRRLRAAQTGGVDALNAVNDSVAAADKAKAAWESFTQTEDGAKFATLAFRDAILQHNSAAEQMLTASQRIVDVQRQIDETINHTSIKKVIDLADRLIQAKDEAAKFGDQAPELGAKFLTVFTELNHLWDQQTDRLSAISLELRKTIELLDDAFTKFGKMPDLRYPIKSDPIDASGLHRSMYSPELQLAMEGPGRILDGRPGIGDIDPLTGRRPFQIDPTNLGTIAPAKLPPGPSINEARFRAVVATVQDSLSDLGGKIKDVASSSFFAILRSIGSQLNPFSQVVSAISAAAKPLVPIMTQLANIVAHTLGPVFEAFAPVLQALLPLLDALFRVLSPILRALAPLFMAFIPILNALFPIIKGAAIAFTYVVQAASYLAGIFFNIAGGFATLVGGVIAAIGAIISKIPFLGGFGRSIRDAGNDIKNLGHGMEETANGLFETARQMGDARKEIEGINLDPTQTALDGLTDAANSVTASLLNVPTGYKVALARFNATAPVSGSSGFAITPPAFSPPVSGGTLPTPGAPASAPSSGTGGTPPSDGSGTGPNDGGGSEINGGASGNIIFGPGSVVIQGADKSADDLFNDMVRAGKKKARAQFGDESKWGQVTVGG